MGPIAPFADASSPLIVRQLQIDAVAPNTRNFYRALSEAGSPEAEPFEQPQACVIARIDVGQDLGQGEIGKGIVDQSPQGFLRIALPPIGPGEEIADIVAVKERDAADDIARQMDRIFDAVIALHGRDTVLDPAPRRLLIRMRWGRPVAHDRGIGHATVNGAPVRKLQWPQNQPAGIDDGQIQMKPPLTKYRRRMASQKHGALQQSIMLRDAGELARILISLADRQAGESLLYGPRSF